MPNDLSHRITVRLSPEVYAHLETVAGQTERKISDVVRLAILGVAVRPLRRKQVRHELIRQLVRVGNNLNQQTRLLHLLRHRGDFPDSDVLLATLEEVMATLRSISNQLKKRDERSTTRTTR